MKFGCCLPGSSFVPQINEAHSRHNENEREVDGIKRGVLTLFDAGCDFVELNLFTVANLPNEDFAELKAFLKEKQITIETFCSFVPPEVPLVGENVSRPAIMNYVQKALWRATACGAKVVVFGSGQARTAPDGFPKDKTHEQLVEFLRMCSDCSSAMGLLVRIAIEPLNAAESNTVIGLKEGYELWKDARAARCDRVDLLADTYHMHMCGEDFALFEEVSGSISHIHIADANRKLPGKAENGFDFAGFMKTLKKCGYDGRLSVECPMENLADDAKYSMDYLLSL